MRADGRWGVALCKRCHDSYMEIWRLEDAEDECRELAESEIGRAA